MDECTVQNSTEDSFKEPNEQTDKVESVELKSINDDEFKDVNEINETTKELNGLKSTELNKQIEETENQLNDLSLTDKKDLTSKRTDEDASEDEYYDVTSDGSNVDSELSSLHENEKLKHKSLNNDDVLDLNDVNNEIEHNTDEINLESKLDKSGDEREQGDGEVS